MEHPELQLFVGRMGLLFLKLDFGKALFLFLGDIGLHLFNLAGMVCDVIGKALILLISLARVVYNLTDKAVTYLVNLGRVVHNLRVGKALVFIFNLARVVRDLLVD
jgi:hypothetical protein